MEYKRKVGIALLLSVLVLTGYSQDSAKAYRINWVGLGKKGWYMVSKPGKEHTIKLDFAHLNPGEVYEVDVFFNNKKIYTISSSKDSIDTPPSKGKYGFRFYKIEKGKRVKVKPKIIKGVVKKGIKSREGIRVTSSTSSGTITATVDA